MRHLLLIVILLTSSALAGELQDQSMSVATDPNAPCTEHTYTGFTTEQNKAWRLTPAAVYHHACVKVEVPGGVGSGVVISHEGKGVIVVTNHHVVSKGYDKRIQDFKRETHDVATVTGTRGTPVNFEVRYSDPEFDIAILYAPGATAGVSLPVADSMPPVGADIEMVGWGGPETGMRHFLGERVNTSFPVSIDAAAVSGDSGGPMIWGGECVVGINFGAPGKPGSYGTIRTGNRGDWFLSGPASSRIDGPRLAAVLTQQCAPWGCPPVVIRRPVGNFVPRPSPPAIIKPVPQKPCNCDSDKIKAEVVAEMKAWFLANKSQFRGDQGDRGLKGVQGDQGLKGERGKRGAPGDPWTPDWAEVAKEVQKRLDPIQVDTYDWQKERKETEKYPYPGPIKIRYPRSVPPTPKPIGTK